MNICHTVSTTGLFGKSSYSGTLVTYLPGYVRVSRIRKPSFSTHRLTLSTYVTCLFSVNKWWESSKNMNFINK